MFLIGFVAWVVCVSIVWLTMKGKALVIFGLFAITALVCVTLSAKNEGYKLGREGMVYPPRSACPLWLPYSGEKKPGSGHAFGFGVVYTVASHGTYNGNSYAVCVSREPDVEIWSSIPEIVNLPDQSKFLISGDGPWKEVFFKAGM